MSSALGGLISPWLNMLFLAMLNLFFELYRYKVSSIIFQYWDGTGSCNPSSWMIREWPIYPEWSIPWLLLTWRQKEPGHQLPWYWPSSTRTLWFQQKKRSRASAVMISTQFSQVIPVSAPKVLILTLFKFSQIVRLVLKFWQPNSHPCHKELTLPKSPIIIMRLL